MKERGDRGEIDSGLGGIFTVVITEETDDSGFCTVKVDNKQSDFHGQVRRVKYEEIRPPAALVPRETLILFQRNWAIGDKKDHLPVLKLVAKASGGVWLLTEIKEDLDTAFGLCDLGMGFPELGYVSLFEVARVNLGVIAPVITREPYFFADASLAVYTQAARTAQEITFDAAALNAAYDTVLKERREGDTREPWLARNAVHQRVLGRA